MKLSDELATAAASIYLLGNIIGAFVGVVPGSVAAISMGQGAMLGAIYCLLRFGR